MTNPEWKRRLIRWMIANPGFLMLPVTASVVFWQTGCAWIEDKFLRDRQCTCEFRVFSRNGQRLPFRVEAVTLVDRDSDGWKRSGSMDGSRVWFPAATIGSVVRVRLSDEAGHKLDKQVSLTACNQRTSFLYVSRNEEKEHPAFEISGRLTGCRLNSQWWVRAMDMFGEMTGGQLAFGGMPTARDGFLDAVTGEFTIPLGSAGTQIVVVGFDKHPLASFAAGTVERSPGRLGSIDISGVCPTASR